MHLNSNPTEQKSTFDGLRVAIVHYWFVSLGGGEKVVESLLELFPQADLFALVVDPESLPVSLKGRDIKTSFLQRLPFARKYHRHFLPLYPLALENLDLGGYDLVISSESGPAKGVLTSSTTCHVCYCHSPMRYLWDMYSEYTRQMSPIVRTVYSLLSPRLRLWDLATASRVDFFIANSNFVARRIRKQYRRSSSVIHPPVDVSKGTAQNAPGEFFLCVGRLVGYKRVDLAIEACNRLGRRLRIVGDGPLFKQLKRLSGPTIEFAGVLSESELCDSFARSRALLFPGEEDFGIVPVESQSYGRPVIAYRSGGSLETVRGLSPGDDFVDSCTGIFFEKQTVSDLVDAISRFERYESQFCPDTIRDFSLQFASARFKTEITQFITSRYDQFKNSGPPEH